MGIDINYWAVLLAALSSMVVGAIWYSKKVFGAEWAKLVGLSDEQMNKGAAYALTLTALISFVTAYALAFAIGLADFYYTDSGRVQIALTVGFVLWLGLTAGRMVTHDLFEQRRRKLSALNLGNEFVTIMVMALIIGLLP